MDFHEFIEKEIIPQYAEFDAAHHHVFKQQSLTARGAQRIYNIYFSFRILILKYFGRKPCAVVRARKTARKREMNYVGAVHEYGTPKLCQLIA